MDTTLKSRPNTALSNNNPLIRVKKMNIGTSDDLARMETVDLERLQSILKDRINQTRRARGDSIPHEIDLTYVQRELSERVRRDEWIARNIRE